MARRSDHTREELREMALAAATEIVKNKGIQKLTTRSVAKKIGYSPGTLYLIFKDIDDLIFVMNARTLADMRVKMHAAVSHVADPLERLEAMASFYLDYGLQDIDLWRVMFEHRALGDAPFPEFITRETDELLLGVGQALKQLMPGMGDAELHQNTVALWSGVHGVAHLAITDKIRVGSDEAYHSIMQRQLDTFVRGLLADVGN